MTAPAITAADVRAGVARELRALAEGGVTGPEAVRRAVEITAGKVRNAPALVERQAHPGLCHACGGALDNTRAVVAVLQAKGGGSLWLHSVDFRRDLTRVFHRELTRSDSDVLVRKRSSFLLSPLWVWAFSPSYS